MAQAAVEGLISIGHHVQFLDLHAEEFDPVIRKQQFPVRTNPRRFEVMTEQAAQTARGDVPEDILLNQQRLIAADNLILQFPLWWWSLPAQLKGWIDRTLSAGFAYGEASLAGRSAMLTVTAETKAERFLAQGPDNPLHHIERGMLKFCGYTVRPAFVVADVYAIGEDGRKAKLAELREHVRTHFRQSGPQSLAC